MISGALGATQRSSNFLFMYVTAPDNDVGSYFIFVISYSMYSIIGLKKLLIDFVS